MSEGEIPMLKKGGKPVYMIDSRLPKGWTFFNHGTSTFFKDEKGTPLKHRRSALAEMFRRGYYTKQEVTFLRDGLQIYALLQKHQAIYFFEIS